MLALFRYSTNEMDIKQALFKAIKKLEKTSGSPRLDAEILLSCTINKPREFILSHPEKTVTKNQEKRLKKYIERRAAHEPIAYILGWKEFYGIDFKVTKDTLVPRPETELLVENALDKIQKTRSKKQEAIIMDIGTGSGNIIISIAKAIEANFQFSIFNFQFMGIDLSEKALRIAKHNAKKNNLENKIKFLRGNLLEPFIKKFDSIGNWKLEIGNSRIIILANLPYLDKGWKNSLNSSDTKGLKYEPDIALYSGEDGLDSYRELAGQLKQLSLKNTTLLCEIGHKQVASMKKIFSFARKIYFHKDLSKKWRIAEIYL